MPTGIANAKPKSNSSCLCAKQLATAIVANMNPQADIRRANLHLLMRRYDKQVVLAEALGLAPAFMSALLSGERNMGEKLARKVEQRLGESSGWLDQPHDALGNAPADVVKDCAAMVTDRGDAVQNTQAAPDRRGVVPLISWVQAGDWMEAQDHYATGDAEAWMPCPTGHGPHTFALRVRGDSMTAGYGRSYPNGCLIYVDPDQRGGITSGDRVVARLTGSNEVTFKVFIEDAGRLFLKPLNPQYPIIDAPFDLIGKVICKLELE